jgi:uncharacterized protein (DUF736 family)
LLWIVCKSRSCTIWARPKPKFGSQNTSKVQTKHKIFMVNKRKIGALWSKKASEGKEYFTGVISDLRGEIQIVVFRNDKKQNENQPDYDILLSEPKEEGEIRL